MKADALKPTTSWRTAGLVALASFALVVYPPAYALLCAGAKAGFAYVVGDAFLYLTIARNSTLFEFSFDGTTITNGFHPLWQYVLTVLFSGDSVDAGDRQVIVTTALSALLVGVGAALTSLAILRFTHSRLLSMLTVPGVYYLLIGALVTNQAIWENVGGMECGLSVFFGGVILFLLARRLADREVSIEELVDETPLRSLFTHLGWVLPFAVLTRLDDVFLVFALGATPLFADRSWRVRIMASLRVMMPTGVVLVVYMAHNKVSAGTFMPISGMTKAGFVMPMSLYITASGLFPPLLNLKNALVEKQSDPVAIYFNVFRSMQLLYPVLFAVIAIFFGRRLFKGRGKVLLLGALAAHVLIKGSYNLLNVHLWHQGTWYFALNVLFLTFFAALLLEAPYRRAATTKQGRLVLGLLLGVYVALASGRQALKAAYLEDTQEYLYFQARSETARALSSKIEDPKLVAFDDGFTGYALPFATIHGFAFAADLDTFKALKEQRLLAHVYERGHRILTSICYLPMAEPVEGSDALRAWLKASFLEDDVKAELDQFDYRLLYIEPSSKAPFIELIPRKPTT